MLHTILVVDDEEFNLDILNEYLIDDGYQTVLKEDGQKAWEYLENTNQKIDLIVLDRMMPNMNGMEFLKLTKSDERFQHIPIIMQTAAASSAQILEGIKAGVYYYLTKPYEKSVLLAIVKSALNTVEDRENLDEEIAVVKIVHNLIKNINFEFKTLDEAKNLAHYISSLCIEPQQTLLGLTEILINAIEHGNLGITFDEKSELLLKGEWDKEVSRRLSLIENLNKKVKVEVINNNGEITITVEDEGNGFNYNDFLEFNPERLTLPNGRGIAIANNMSFKKLEYVGKGNKVICTVSNTEI